MFKERLKTILHQPGFLKEAKIFTYVLVAAAVGAVIGSHGWAAFSPSAPVAAATAPITPGSIENTFAPVVDRDLPAIVNISSSKKTKLTSQEMPFQMDPFFRQFFGQEGDDDNSGSGRGERHFNQRGFQMPRSRVEHSLGSGVIVRPDGYLLTNNHVIDGATDITVTLNDKRELKAKVIGTDAKTDIAVLKVDAANLPTIAFADSSKAHVGDVVLAMGNPFGLSQTVTMGIISAKGRTNLGIEAYEDFIQTDAAINPGNSGGALVNARGELIGINTAILANNGGNQGVGFAVPVNLANSVMTQVMDHGKVVRGYLGVLPQTITPALAASMHLNANERDGVLMGDVTSGAPAAKAGIERGDVVTEVNGQKVEDANQLRMKISMMAPGSTANLHVLHNGSEKTVAVKLGELPNNPDEPGENVENGSGSNAPSALDGVSVDNLTADNARELKLSPSTHGVVITDVADGSAASAAGLRQGDVILEVNRTPVANSTDFDKAIRASRGGNVLLLVNRGGLTQYIAVQSK